MRFFWIAFLDVESVYFIHTHFETLNSFSLLSERNADGGQCRLSVDE